VFKPISLPRQLVSRSVVSSRGSAEGSILIIALWSLCLLATFTVILGYEVRQKLTLVKRLEERDKLRLIAEAAVKKTILQIKTENQNPKNYYTLNDVLSNNIGAFKDIEIGDGKANICYNYIDEQSGERLTRYGTSDEEGKININKIDLAVLERLFIIGVGLDQIEAQELAASIIDWRDSDSELSIPSGSAESQYYRNLEYPCEAKNAEFEVLDELLLVKGITQDIFEKIKNYITIYGEGRVNINTAPKIVLLALGLNEDNATKILFWRYGQDGIIGTSDDNIFEDTSDIIPKLRQAYSLNDAEVAHMSRVSDQYLSTKSDNFMIRSVARLNNRETTSEVICVADRIGKIMYWQES